MGQLSWTRRQQAIDSEAALDGNYRRAQQPSASATLRRRYCPFLQQLADVKRAFRSLKGSDLRVRPIYHRTEDHVRAHQFLCLLAHCVEWHMRRALAPILFHDEALPEPDNSAILSRRLPYPGAAKQKTIRRRTVDDDLPVHSFDALLQILGLRCRNRCSLKSDPSATAFFQLTEPDPLQKRALELLGL